MGFSSCITAIAMGFEYNYMYIYNIYGFIVGMCMKYIYIYMCFLDLYEIWIFTLIYRLYGYNRIERVEWDFEPTYKRCVCFFCIFKRTCPLEESICW